jgi:molybdopterin-guanine dinucleotide biosynthesis protein A
MFSIVIQSGGESRRMGQDKAWLPFLGQPLIWRVIGRLRPLADELLVTTNRRADYESLGLPLLADLVPGRGALGGLFTALQAAPGPLVGVVACDMPFVNAALLQAARDILLADPSLDAVIPRNPEGTEPFHAVYRRETCLPLVKQAVQGERWRVDSWFSQARLRFLSSEECREFDPQGLAFWNLNTPEEFAHAEQLAQMDSAQG